MSLLELTLTIRRGATIDLPIRVESSRIAYRAITSISRTAPMRVTATGHGLPPSWRAAIHGAGGIVEANALSRRLREIDLWRAEKVDANTIDFVDVDATSYHAYTSGGTLAYYSPLDLSAYTAATMMLKTDASGSAQATWNTSDGTMQLDASNAALWLRLSVAQSEAVAAGTYLFDIELTRSAGGVDAICAPTSTLVVQPEITA